MTFHFNYYKSTVHFKSWQLFRINLNYTKSFYSLFFWFYLNVFYNLIMNITLVKFLF